MRLIYALTAMVLGGALCARADGGYRSMAVNLTDGSKVEINLTDRLSASFSANSLVITGVDSDVRVAKSNIKSFSFSQTAGITSAAVAAPRLDGRTLRFSGLADGTSVHVSNAAGQLLLSDTASGNYDLSLDPFAPGAVMVSVNGITYKIALK